MAHLLKEIQKFWRGCLNLLNLSNVCSGVIVTQEALSTPNPKTGGHNDLNFLFWFSSKIFKYMNGLATMCFTISDKIEMHKHLSVAAAYCASNICKANFASGFPLP